MEKLCLEKNSELQDVTFVFEHGQQYMVKHRRESPSRYTTCVWRAYVKEGVPFYTLPHHIIFNIVAWKGNPGCTDHKIDKVLLKIRNMNSGEKSDEQIDKVAQKIYNMNSGEKCDEQIYKVVWKTETQTSSHPLCRSG